MFMLYPTIIIEVTKCILYPANIVSLSHFIEAINVYYIIITQQECMWQGQPL